jgi:hypothetical protein
MNEEDQHFKEVLSRLKDEFNLVSGSIADVSFNDFMLFNKGDNFKIIYAWKLEAFESVYLIEYKNSYRVNSVEAQLEYRINTSTSRYLGCFIKSNFVIPNLVIRPNTLADRLVRLFLQNGIKIKANPAFNKKYLLESEQPFKAVQALDIDFYNLITDTNTLNLQVKNNQCLIFDYKPLDYHNCRVMIQLAQTILKRNMAINSA